MRLRKGRTMPKLSQTLRVARWRAVGPHLPLVVSCALLLGYAHPPALDWPQHQAVGGVLAALWRGDPCVTEHYTFVMQPVPYHLLYVLLAPATWALGHRWGGACTLALLCVLTHLAFKSWARALRRDERACALSPLLFFSACFAWGFGPTFAGLPPALMALAGLSRAYHALTDPPARLDASRPVATAGLWAALAVAAHGVYLPALALAGLPLVTLSGCRVRGLRLLALYVALCALPAVPLAFTGLNAWIHAATRSSSAVPELTFETLSSGWDHLRLTFAAFDRGFCRNAHQLLTCVSLVAVAWRARNLSRPARAVAWVAAAHLAMVWLVPLNIGATPPAWLLNVRFVPLFEGAVWLLALPEGRRAHSGWCAGHYACAAVFLIGLNLVFSHFNRAATYIDGLQRALPVGTVLPAGGTPQKFAQAWPPLMRHLSSALVPHPVCVSYNLFVGGHFPIAYRAEVPRALPTSPYPEPPQQPIHLRQICTPPLP